MKFRLQRPIKPPLSPYSQPIHVAKSEIADRTHPHRILYAALSPYRAQPQVILTRLQEYIAIHTQLLSFILGSAVDRTLGTTSHLFPWWRSLRLLKYKGLLLWMMDDKSIFKSSVAQVNRLL